MGYLTDHAGLWLAIFLIEPKELKLGRWLAHGQKNQGSPTGLYPGASDI